MCAGLGAHECARVADARFFPVDSVEEKCEAAVARLEAVLIVLSRAEVQSLCAEDDFGKEPESDQVTEQRPATVSVRELAMQFGSGVVLVEVKQPRLIAAVRESRRRVGNGIRAHLERRRLQVGKAFGEPLWTFDL